MKRKTMMMLALAGFAGVALNAENTTAAATTTPAQKAQVATPAAAQKTEAVASKASADEQAFVAKLNDLNREAFKKLSAEQKKAAMVAVKNGANADKAVQELIVAKDLKGAPSVANADNNSTQAK